MLRNSKHAWGAVSQWLHWLIVVLLVMQYSLGWLAASLPPGLDKLVLLSRHKSLGILILALAAMRLGWRALNPTPAMPAGMTVSVRRLAHVTHALMYAGLLALPLSGWIMSSARNFPVAFFNLFQLPDLVSPGESVYLVSRTIHVGLTWLLLASVALHILAALKHHFLDRDDVLRRMLPLPRRH